MTLFLQYYQHVNDYTFLDYSWETDFKLYLLIHVSNLLFWQVQLKVDDIHPVLIKIITELSTLLSVTHFLSD